jgi:uncharacterized protein (DUF2141 family)
MPSERRHAARCFSNFNRGAIMNIPFTTFKARRLLPIVAAGALLLSGAVAGAADLKVSVQNLASKGGTVYLALYDSAGAFPQPGKNIAGQFMPVGDGPVAAAFLNLKPGRYALSVFHDENGNGKLDTNLLGVPTERVGFSRDAKGSFGPPKFDAAAIDVSVNTSIVITLH